MTFKTHPACGLRESLRACSAPFASASSRSTSRSPKWRAAAGGRAAEPTVNKGDTAWMLTATVLRAADDDSGPRAVLRRPGAHQEHALGADVGVLLGLHRDRAVGALRLQPRLHRRLDAFVGGFSKAFLSGVTPDSKAATFSVGANIPELVYICFQMTFAAITPALIVGAFVERMKFSAMALFLPLWVIARLLPDRPHGLVLGRPGRDRRRRQGARRRGRRRRQDRRAGQARRGQRRLPA